MEWQIVLTIVVIAGLFLTCLNIFTTMRNNKRKTLEEGREKGLAESKIDGLCKDVTELKDEMKAQSKDMSDIKDMTKATAAKVILIESSLNKVWEKHDALSKKVDEIDAKIKVCRSCNSTSIKRNNVGEC